MTTTSTPAAPTHSAQPEWHSGGHLPGSGRWSAYTDYRWQCACGLRYDGGHGDGINPRHYAHLAEVERATKPLLVAA